MDKVLVITGGLLNEKETSVLRAVRKQILQWRAAQSAWLDLKIKLVIAEPMLQGQLHKKLNRHTLPPTVLDYFARKDSFVTPELTEVVLTTLLRQQGMDYACASVDDVFRRSPGFVRALAECNCVMLSSTLLRDLSEVVPLLRLLKQAHNRIILGGALANLLANDWQGCPEVDVLAVGYGELLLPALVRYIRSGFTELLPPEHGRLELRPQAANSKIITLHPPARAPANTQTSTPTSAPASTPAHTPASARASLRVMRSGVPEGRDLDFLPTPDWAQAERDYGRRFEMIYYESVRGCPYRCNFCNYPNLFDDTRFRYKSAQKIADDWQRYSETTGANYITCLDSLFTMPRSRLTTLCNELVKRDLKLKWICYARADDLAKLEIASMMQEAGAHQVQIGIESGDQTMLDNMDKQCTVEANHQALANCRQIGLTSVISLIVGFPGETAQTLENTWRFLETTPPDFYFLATFSTRVAGVPILNPANRQRFGLLTDSNPNTVAPYWEHATMSSQDVGNHVRRFNQRLMQNKIALNAPLFFGGMLGFEASQREALLTFQQQAASSHPWLSRSFDMANAWLDKHLARDLLRTRAQWPAPSTPPAAAK